MPGGRRFGLKVLCKPPSMVTVLVEGFVVANQEDIVALEEFNAIGPEHAVFELLVFVARGEFLDGLQKRRLGTLEREGNLKELQSKACEDLSDSGLDSGLIG